MNPAQAVSLRAAPPAPQRPVLSVPLLLRASLALLLALGLFTVFVPASSAAYASAPSTVQVVLHFKDNSLETVDFASYSAAAAVEDDSLVVRVNEDPEALSFDSPLSFEVYDQFATFDNQQRDITDLCRYDAEAGTVTIPRDAITDESTLAIVFWLTPAHPAYERYVTADLDTSDLVLTHQGAEITFQSDVPDLVAQAKQESYTTDGLALQSETVFPGESEKHYLLNPRTRLENFDVSMTDKQAAFGFPTEMLGQPGFGVFFGSDRDTQTDNMSDRGWDEPVLDTTSTTYDQRVEDFFQETIAAKLGSKARFSISRDGEAYQAALVTSGSSYLNSSHSYEKAPSDKAMSQGVCGSSGVINGGGALMADESGNNYIAYEGILGKADPRYEGWAKFKYKFDAKSVSSGQPFQDIIGYLLISPAPSGRAQALKVSADPSITATNRFYSLKNAVIAAFSKQEKAQNAAAKAANKDWGTWEEARDWAQSDADMTFVTKADGKSNIVEDARPGTYYAVELFAPPGFRLSDDIKTLSVQPRESQDNPDTVTFVDYPEGGVIELVKTSSNQGLTDGNPSYSLDGATYGVFTDAACLNKFGEISVTLNDRGLAVGRLTDVPLGSYWVKETTRAAHGYALDSRTYAVTVADDDVTRVNDPAVKTYPKLNPLRIMLQKLDHQTQKPLAQGGASLGDAQFRVNYYATQKGTAESLAQEQPRASWVVRTNDEGVFSLQDADGSFTHHSSRGADKVLPYKVSGSSFYRASDTSLALPLGSYTIQEIQAPEGYLVDPAIHVRHVDDEDHDQEFVVNFQAIPHDDGFTSQVARSELTFMKNENEALQVAGIPFKVTSKTTGEWHILVTDKTGRASTAAAPHSELTNGNDAQFRAEDGSFAVPFILDEAALNSQAGLWFSGSSETETAPDDTLGALPFDQYDVEEIRCLSNELFDLSQGNTTVDTDDHGTVIDMGTLSSSDNGGPRIATTALDLATDSHVGVVRPEAAIIDTVFYEGLTPGQTYTLTAVLMNAATEAPLENDGAPVTSEASFTPEEASGSVDMSLSFSAEDLNGIRVVVFESLSQEGEEVALHADLASEEQSVTYQLSSGSEAGEPGSDFDEADGNGDSSSDEATSTTLKDGSEGGSGKGSGDGAGSSKAGTKLSQTGDEHEAAVRALSALALLSVAVLALVLFRRLHPRAE